tara:strand:- start:96 stop:206 length:111 start_codon:yes stop_codon:yes gene_type:complete
MQKRVNGIVKASEFHAENSASNLEKAVKYYKNNGMF